MMTTPEQPAPSTPAPARHARPALPDGLVLGMAIGFAVWLPFMLFSAQFLTYAVSALFASVVVGLVVCALIALLLFLFRKRIAASLFGEVQLSITAVTDAAADAVRAWPDQGRSAAAAAVAAREAVAVATWFMARRTLTTVLLGMVGSVIAMVGTVLLLKQTQALEDQNKKLDVQTSLLERQNVILASEGLWEHFWNVHYASNPEIRINAAVEVSAKGHILRGVVLEGPSPPDSRFVHLREKPRFDDGEFDATVALVTVPGRLTRAIEPQTFRALAPGVAGGIEHSELRNLSVDFSDERKPKLRGLSFVQSLVDLSARDRGARLCIDCSFTSSEVRVQEGRASFENSSFRNARLSSGMGELFLHNCRFDALVLSATWGRDQVRDTHGYALVVDYHGWSGEDARPTFDSSAIEHLFFRWDDRRMADVEGFLQRTIHSSATIGRLYFVEERVSDGDPHLVILREPTTRANAWNSGGRR